MQDLGPYSILTKYISQLLDVCPQLEVTLEGSMKLSCHAIEHVVVESKVEQDAEEWRKIDVKIICFTSTEVIYLSR